MRAVVELIIALRLIADCLDTYADFEHDKSIFSGTMD